MPSTWNWPVKADNQTIWCHNRLELEAVIPLVAIEHLLLMEGRSAHLPDSSVNKTPTIGEGEPFAKIESQYPHIASRVNQG